MKKICLPLITLLFTGIMASAQSGKGIVLSFGPEFSIPLNTSTYDYGRIRDSYQDGIGGNFKIELPVTLLLHFTVSAGFVSYSSNAYYEFIVPTSSTGAYSFSGGTPPPYQFIPIKAGLRYYYAKYFYLGAQGGAAIKTSDYATTSFIYSGDTGFIIPLVKRSNLDFGLSYQRGFEIYYYPAPMSQISISVAYRFVF